MKLKIKIILWIICIIVIPFLCIINARAETTYTKTSFLDKETILRIYGEDTIIKPNPDGNKGICVLGYTSAPKYLITVTIKEEE